MGGRKGACLRTDSSEGLRLGCLELAEHWRVLQRKGRRAAFFEHLGECARPLVREELQGEQLPVNRLQMPWPGLCGVETTGSKASAKKYSAQEQDQAAPCAGP